MNNDFNDWLLETIQSRRLIDTKEIFDCFVSLNIKIKLRHKTLSEVVHSCDTPQALGEAIYAYTKLLLCYELIKKSKTLSLQQTLIILQTMNKNEKIIKIFKTLDMEVFTKFWKLLINENRQKITTKTNTTK